jgi:outer membrane lipoprotein LolB
VVDADRRQGARETALYAYDRFVLRGRLAVSDGRQGGSGSFEWRQQGRATEFRFSTPVSKQTWVLHARPGTVELRRSDGRILHGFHAAELIARETGWRVPVDELVWWIRGLRAPDRPAEVHYGSDGRLAALQQAGWRIDYRELRPIGGVDLPTRLEARSPPWRVRLVIDAWQLE